jgi:hypothetical protein
VLGAVLTIGAIASAAETAPAKMRIVDITPVKVQGLHFRAGERVRVVLNADGRRHVRIVRAERGGSFATRFAVYAEACAVFNLRATGTSGTVAIATRKPPPSCAALDPVP